MSDNPRTFIIYDFELVNVTPLIMSVAKRDPKVGWPGSPNGARQGAIWNDVVQPGIEGSERLLAYVDLPNANVTFEAGYALGLGQRVALARAQERVPDWLNRPPLNGLLCEWLESEHELEARIKKQDQDWISVDQPPESGSEVLFLCPASGPGSSYRRLKPDAWIELPKDGWGIHDIPARFKGVGHVVWIISGHNKGPEMRDGPENAAMALLAGYAKALSGVRLHVLSANSARSVADVVTERRQFRDDGSDLQELLKEICSYVEQCEQRDAEKEVAEQRLSPSSDPEASPADLKRVYDALQDECRTSGLPSSTLMATTLSLGRLAEIVDDADHRGGTGDRQRRVRHVLDALKRELLIDYEAHSRLGDEHFRIRVLRSDEDLIWEDWAPFYREVMLTIWLPGVVNPLFGMLEQIDSEEIRRCVDFGCGHGHLVERLQAMFPHASVLGLDYSHGMIEIAKENYPECEFDWGTMFDLSAWREQVDLATSTNSILPNTSEAAFRMFREVSSTVRRGGFFAGVLPSGDTIEHLIERATEEKIAAGLAPEQAREEVEAYYVRLHGFDSREGFYRDDPDGKHPQRVYWPHEIRELLESLGFDGVSLEKVYYPWSACKAFGWGHFPWAERVWDWAFRARKV